MTTTHSEMCRTACMSCSTKMTVMPASRSAWMWPSSVWTSAGFTPAIGSSSMMISGSVMSARAISSSLRWPPDRLPAKSDALASSLKRARISRARSAFSRSWRAHSGRTSAPSMPSPRWPRAARSMLSRTVRRASAFVSWKVRTTPWRATWAALRFARGMEPLRSQRPVSARSKPVSRLKKVVFPAPLGPMRAVMAPRWNST